MQLNNFLDQAFNQIQEKHDFHEKLIDKLTPIKYEKIGGIQLVNKISKLILNETIAGVDSGFVSKKLSFMDLVLIRSVGAIFYFKNGVLLKEKPVDYYPTAYSFPNPFLLKSGLEKDEEMQSISLIRLREEIKVSIEIIEKYKPKYIFVDGSIIPQYQDKPRDNSKISNDYLSIINLFQLFYEKAEENNCRIISCVEDSKGTRFKQILEEKVLPKTTFSQGVLKDSFDSALLDFLLIEGERTFAFPYTKTVSKHAILKDMSEKWSNKINVFYLKASNLDKPLRVEFISKGDAQIEANEIANVVYTLSSIHKEYSYPSVLIEADMRAGLNDQDILVVYERLIDKLGPKIRMRRNSRPFK